MKRPYRLIFFGNERLVSGLKHSDTPVLKGLIERDYDIAAIVVNHTDSTSRNARKLEVAQIAADYGIPLLSPEKPSDIIEQLASYNADAAVLSAYGRILSQRVIDLFKPIGIINIHPSLLPKYRGPTPIESTILHGDMTAGVSIMQLSAGMDEGPVYAQARINVPRAVNKFELYETLSKIGAELLFDTLPDILSGSVQPKPQKSDGVSITSLISKKEGQLHPETDDATILERKIRAYQGFPKSHLTLFDNDVIITSAQVVENPSTSQLVIPCANETWLKVDTLVAPSGRTMSGDAFLHGYSRGKTKMS